MHMNLQPEPFSELESLKLKNLRLEGQLLDRAVSDWHRATAALKAELEKTREGWIWQTDTGQWQRKQEGSDASASHGTA